MNRISVAMLVFLMGCAEPDVSRSESALFSCTEHTLAVDVGTTSYDVVGDLCCEAPCNEQTVLLLLSGGTYGRVYWDFSYDPSTYSFVERANDAGYATFNLDRIGIGESDRPPADQVTLQTNIQVIEQVIDALGDSTLVSGGFPRIAVIGHSLSSPMALSFAGSGTPVDAVIATSWLHLPGPGVATGPATSWAAQLDPRFHGQNIPLGYLTSIPGGRGAFYYLPNADLHVVVEDEHTKETVTTGEAESFVAAMGGGAVVPSALAVPVLIQVGANDATFCSPGVCVEAIQEPSFYTSGAPDVVVVPNTGHDTVLHLNAASVQDDLVDWLDANLGT